MTGPSSLALVVPVVLALVPASAGAGAGPPPVALTATPARVVLTGSARTTVRVRNSGTKRVAVDASRAGFALDLRGRPRIVWSGGARSAAGWLTLRPAHFTIGPRSSASLVVASKLPHGAEPGDHDALALLATRPVASGRVGVRLRLGLVVVVRAPGRIVRRLELHALQVTRHGHATVLELTVANLGNVTESLRAVRAVLSKAKNRSSGRGRVSSKSRPAPANARNRRLSLPPHAARLDDRTRRHPGGRGPEASPADVPDQAMTENPSATFCASWIGSVSASFGRTSASI